MKPPLGMIGTGIMGSHMARHLMAAGHPVHVYNRTAARSEPLVRDGAVPHDSIASLASAVEHIITIVGYPRDVEEVYLGPDGLLPHARAGSLLIDMTTSSPSLAKRLHQAGVEKGVEVIDAPVSGGERGAREAKLSIMVGAQPRAFERALPILSLLGPKVVLQGEPGSGQHTKLANQIAIAAGMIAVSEALAYAGKVGLDPARVLESISGGAAGSWSLSNLGPKMLAGDMAPGFYVKHFLKDLNLAFEEAEACGLELPGLALARQTYFQLVEKGHGDLGTQAIFTCYEAD